jgi:uroporphyrinogen-III synthase
VSGGPLAGYRVLVTRPPQQADDLVAAIEGAGGQAIRFPVIRIVGRDPEIVARELATLPRPDIAIFVSRNAVDYGLPAIRNSGAAIAAIGPTTRAAIERAGANVDISSGEGFDSERLLTHPALSDVRNQTIVIVRGENGREMLADTLKERGADVRFLSAYRREIYPASAGDIDSLDNRFRRGSIDCVTVMSVETLQNLLLLLPESSLEALRQTRLVAPGARVIQTATELVPGISAIMASGPKAADMLNALITARHSGQNS